MELLITLAVLTLIKATPIIYAALGGVISERSGVINIGLEGMMAIGAFTAVVTSWVTHEPVLGLIAGVIAGAFAGYVLGIAATRFKVDQIVAGMGLNLMCAGGAAYGLVLLFNQPGASVQVNSLGNAYWTLIALAFVLAAAIWFALYRTPWGLRLRACGENPAAVAAAGLDPLRLRLYAVILSGALAGLGGAFLSIGELNLYSDGMTAGRGFIALAAVIFGRWNPLGATLACVVFGFFEALQYVLQGQIAWLPANAMQALAVHRRTHRTRRRHRPRTRAAIRRRSLLNRYDILSSNVSAHTIVHRILAILGVSTLLLIGVQSTARASMLPAPLRSLRLELHHLVENFPASSAVEVMDLSTGYKIGYNASATMPAASTIKVPVMVEVFRQLEAGDFDLDRRVTLLPSDKDYGSGDLCDAPAYTTYTVETLLSKMIDISDNTATNMLIRLVGLRNINREMADLGLQHTHLRGYVRTDNWDVRQALQSSPGDMVHLLAMMAKRELVDDWSSNEMISILEEDQINTLLPQPLPPGVAIAHKTGSFFDTLNDVGIVYGDTPYVIAVMTTHLPSLSIGRTFIRALSLATFQTESHMATWRTDLGVAPFTTTNGITPPDLRYWQHSEGSATESGGR